MPSRSLALARIASTEPPLIAAENIDFRFGGFAAVRGFNGAAADRGGELGAQLFDHLEALALQRSRR